MLKRQISILGCGHLGKAILDRLSRAQHIVKDREKSATWKASTRSSELDRELYSHVDHMFIDINDINNTKANHSQAHLESGSELSSFLNTDALIISLPPSSSPKYSELAMILIPYIKNKSQIILISSVGAYAHNQGEVDETTTPLGKQTLVEIERNFQEYFPQTNILRLGGIVSPKRQVWNYLNERTIEFDEYLHLVDIENCIDAVESILDNTSIHGEIFNIVNSQRELKSVFYSRKCSQAPQFLKMRANAKVISNLKSISKLKINYKSF